MKREGAPVLQVRQRNSMGPTLRTLGRGSSWLSELLATTPPEAAGSDAGQRKSRSAGFAIACSMVFLIAVGVRLLHWQDSHRPRGLAALTRGYLRQAEQTLQGEGILYSNGDSPESAHLLVHPPGYSIFVAGVFGLFGRSTDSLTLAQIIADALAGVTVVLIAAELFPFAVGVLAGLLTAFSPHLAHYSLFLLPDSLTTLPILIAFYFLIRAIKRPNLVHFVAAGCLIGLSCWLRSNALLLGPAVALALALWSGRGRRLLYSLALLAAAILTISPITIRNWMVFHHFIPLSLGAGVTLIEGIGDYDKPNRFGMPATDADAGSKDIEWHARPDYGDDLWKPDGIERDRYRFRRGFEVIRSNPLWFAGVMIHRAGFMLRYNSPSSAGWPFDTARVPVVALEPSFGDDREIPIGTQPVWTNSPEELKTHGKQLATQAEILLSADGRTLTVTGDASEFEDQVASARIPVERHTNYVLILAARHLQGRVAAKVTSADRRITLGSALILGSAQGATTEDDATASPVAATAMNQQSPIPILDMPFASGERTEVLLVISNNGESFAPSTSQIGHAQLYRVGATPQLWTQIVRPSIRTIQRRLYTTSRMLPLVLAGIGLLAIARRARALSILFVVPFYYLSVQSGFHTEYRYILSIHYFLFVAAAVTLYCGGKLIGRAMRRLIAAFALRSGARL